MLGVAQWQSRRVVPSAEKHVGRCVCGAYQGCGGHAAICVGSSPTPSPFLETNP